MSTAQLPLERTPQLLDALTLRRTIVRLSHQIAEAHPSLDAVLLAGVRTRGVPLAVRIAATLDELGFAAPPVAALDPRGHRDDKPRDPRADPLLVVDGDTVPLVDGMTVIVVDDVIFTGRTLRAALDALISCGRPAAVEVLTLIDRGHREIPFRPTYVGKNVPTAVGDRVQVRLREIDGVDGAWLAPGVAP